MRKIICLFCLGAFLSGCSFVVTDIQDEDVKTYGIQKHEAKEWIGKVQEQRPQELKDVKIMMPKQTQRESPEKEAPKEEDIKIK